MPGPTCVGPANCRSWMKLLALQGLWVVSRKTPALRPRQGHRRFGTAEIEAGHVRAGWFDHARLARQSTRSPLAAGDLSVWSRSAETHGQPGTGRHKLDLSPPALQSWITDRLGRSNLPDSLSEETGTDEDIGRHWLPFPTDPFSAGSRTMDRTVSRPPRCRVHAGLARLRAAVHPHPRNAPQ
jgi:hypothetical protein